MSLCLMQWKPFPPHSDAREGKKVVIKEREREESIQRSSGAPTGGGEEKGGPYKLRRMNRNGGRRKRG